MLRTSPRQFPDSITRREFLLVVTGSAIAVVLAGCRPSSEIPPPTLYKSGSIPLPTDIARQGKSASADPRYSHLTHDQILITDNRYFYVQSYNSADPPAYEAVLNRWTLQIDGLVENPLILTYEDIRQLPEAEVMRTLECIGNPVGGSLIGNAVWSGFWLQEILHRAGVKSEATRARFEASDEYSTAVDVEWIMQPDVLMAYKMNGQLLPREHGYPLRILIPGLYGQKMPKWIKRIEFIDYDYQGYWEKQGWSDVAQVQTNSILQSPPHQTEIQGQVALQGISFAGRRKITAVEVRIDDDNWMPATLVPGESPLVWTQWHILWIPPGPGTYAIAVRATDDTGFRQRSEADGAFGNARPLGTNAIHRIVVQAV